MKRRVFLLALLASLGLGALLCADFIIAIGDTTISQGGTGSVDVSISSTVVPAGNPLSSANFKFTITPVNPALGPLQFVSPQPDAQLNLSNYVFFGNSADKIVGTPVGAVTSSAINKPNDTFVGGDDTNDGSNVTVTGNKLLARLQFSAAAVTPPTGGKALFTIALAADPRFTSFTDSNFTAINFTSTPGTVTVLAGATAVPEPASLALFAVGGLFSLFVGHRARRKPPV